MAESSKKDKIIELVKELNVMELAELVKALEEEFGVSAAAPVAAVAGPAAGEAAKKRRANRVWRHLNKFWSKEDPGH